MEENESEKMIQFLEGIQAPALILIAAHGESLGSMTNDAWKSIVSSNSIPAIV